MVWAEMVMDRNGHGPKWLWAEMTRNPQFYNIKVGFKGVFGHVFMMIPEFVANPECFCSEQYMYVYCSLRREYPPVSLLQLQRMIDLGRVNPEEQIDLNTICNTRLIKLNSWDKQYGINLIDEVSYTDDHYDWICSSKELMPVFTIVCLTC